MLCKKCTREIPNTAAHCAYCGTATSGSSGPQSPGSINNFTSATRGKRFINLLVDGFLLQIISSLLGAVGLRYLFGEYGYGGSWVFSWLLIPFGYYFISELMWSKTPAKFLTKTRVVTERGDKPTASHVAIRTLCRFIPFEALSFLFKSRPVGWHDRFAHTVVVEDR